MCKSEAEKQEAVAIHQFRNPHCGDWYDGVPDHHDGHGPYEVRTLYTHPQPKREWVGLTVMEAVELDIATNHPREFAAAIEAKLKEKNT